MKLPLLYCLLFIPATGILQEIKEFGLYCDPADFEYIYEHYEEDIYIPASLSYNGNTWDDVQLRIRGDGSRAFPKKSLKVEFGDNLFVTGESELNFNAEYLDKSYMHSFLSALLFREAGLHCFNAEHVRLHLNGSYFGLYLLTQDVDEFFLQNSDLSDIGNLYKAALDGACMSTSDNIFYQWDLKSGTDEFRDGLAQLIHFLNEIPDAGFKSFVEQNFNDDNVYSFVALNWLIANGSTYYHNYFLFYDMGATNQWFFLPWDMDRTLTSYGVNYPYHRTSRPSRKDNPLPERMFMDPECMSVLETRVAELTDSFFNNDFISPVIDSLLLVLEASVLEDETDNIPDLETWHNKVEHIVEYIDLRPGVLLSQINHYPRTFKLKPKINPISPGDSTVFTWHASSDPNNDEITYIFSFSDNHLFELPNTIVLHNLQDTAYIFKCPEQEGKYFWRVEATDGNAVVPGYDTYNPVFISDPVAMIVINEINYNSPENVNSGDWIELFNCEESDVDVSGWYLKDEDDQHVFEFPEGTYIPAKEYLVVSSDQEAFISIFTDTIPVLGNMVFGLSGSGELVRLYHPIGYLVDSLVYRDYFPWPTEPDGEGPSLELTDPFLNNALGENWNASAGFGSPGSHNSLFHPDNVHEPGNGKISSIEVFPNPFSSEVSVTFLCNHSEIILIELFNIRGNLMLERHVDHSNEIKKTIKLKTGDLPAGIYLLKLTEDDGYVKTARIIRMN